MKKTLSIFALGSVFFVFFVFFSYLVYKDLFIQFDFDTTVRLQDKIPRRFDELFSSLSLIGSFEVATIILLIVLVIRRKLRGIIVLLFFLGLHFLEIFGKVFVDHPGPPFMFFRYNLDFFFPSAYVQPGSSYPSGHAARTAFLSIVLLFFFMRLRRVSKAHKIIIFTAVAAFDILMFVSRAYLGEHWTSDVVGGALLGVATALMGLAVF